MGKGIPGPQREGEKSPAGIPLFSVFPSFILSQAPDSPIVPVATKAHRHLKPWERGTFLCRQRKYGPRRKGLAPLSFSPLFMLSLLVPQMGVKSQEGRGIVQ